MPYYDFAPLVNSNVKDCTNCEHYLTACKQKTVLKFWRKPGDYCSFYRFSSKLAAQVLPGVVVLFSCNDSATNMQQKKE